MPRGKQTAIASSANVIKININTKTKKPRKRKPRKTVPKALPPIPPPVPFMRSTPDFTNQLRDIQTSQINLSDLTKRNTDEIRRLNTLSTAYLATSRATPAKVEAPSTPKPSKPSTPKPFKPKANTPKSSSSRIKEIKTRLGLIRGAKKLTFDSSSLTDPEGLAQSGAVPAPRNPAIGGAGAGNASSYQAVLDESGRDEAIRTKYVETIKGFDDVSKLKGWANRNLDTNQNRNTRDLQSLKDYLIDNQSFYDTFYAKEMAQYPTPEKGGAADY